MKRTKTTIPVKCEICDHTSKDSSAHSAHLNRKHSIKSNDEKISYLLKYDTENNYYCETDDGKLMRIPRARELARDLMVSSLFIGIPLVGLLLSIDWYYRAVGRHTINPQRYEQRLQESPMVELNKGRQ